MTPAERQQAADSWRRRWRRTSSGAPDRARSRSPTPTRRRRCGIRCCRASRGAAVARSVRAIEAGRRAAAVVGRRDRVRAGDAAVALDRVAAAHVRAADEHLSRAHRAARPKIRSVITLTRDHALARAKAADAEIARRQVSRSAARHSVRREGSARHEGHSHDLRRRAVPQSRADGRLRRRPPAERRRRGARRQALARRARAQRHLVRRPDDEPVAARGRRVGIERRVRARRRRRRSSAFSIGSETGGSIVVAGDALRRHRVCGRRSAACRAPAR